MTKMPPLRNTLLRYGMAFTTALKRADALCHIRRIKSFPQQKRVVVDAYANMAVPLDYDRIADIPTGVTPVVSSVCDLLGESQITPRPPKDHGAQAEVEGHYNEGDTVLVMEDLVTTGSSILEGVTRLRNKLLKVNDVIALVDREQGGRANLEATGLNFISYCTWSELMDLYLDLDLVTQEIFDKTVPQK